MNFMQKALSLAEAGTGKTHPNPMVGAVIVKSGRIIGQGYHKAFGGSHAEIEAIKSCSESIAGATIYVNLEPCAHQGKTPPCVDSLIGAGIKKVICSSLDPNPNVHGKGLAKLKRAGIKVEVGAEKYQARSLNEAYFTFHEKKRPFIALKFAASLDGKIATAKGDSKWITGKDTREYARKLRGQYQAILVGINTIINDDPNLGLKNRSVKDPIRVILDSKLRLPSNSRVLRDKNVIVATNVPANSAKTKRLLDLGVEVISFSGTQIPLKNLLLELKNKNIISVFVEGGGKTLGSFLDEDLVDKLHAFYAPLIIGGENAKSAIGGEGFSKIDLAKKFKIQKIEQINEDFVVVCYPT